MENFENSTFNQYFQCFVSPAYKLSERGRRAGGVICLISNSVAEYIKPVECAFDNALVFIISKFLLHCEKDVILVCVYVPPAGSPYYDLRG